MRLIDADALKTSMDECIYSDRDRFSTGYAKSFIDNAPTVDAVPVVRCSECKYNNACFTQSFVESEGVLPFDRNTWFCADGERKGEMSDGRCR